MSDVKAKMTEVIQAQPEDASYEEIIRELVFERMIERGMEDSRSERLIANDDMERRIRSWPNRLSDQSDSHHRYLGVFHGALDIDRYFP